MASDRRTAARRGTAGAERSDRGEPAEHADGRTARRDRNRLAVLDAVLELFSEDNLEPGPAEVAERSGVSLRSVYRYYEDRDALARAAIARNLERVQPLFEIGDLGVGPLEDRIERMVAGRLRLYEATAPMVRATVLRSRTNDVVRGRLEQNRRLLREQVEAMFAPELVALPAAERREIAVALDVLLGFDALEHLRRQRSLSGAETRRVLVRALRSLVGQAHPPA